MVLNKQFFIVWIIASITNFYGLLAVPTTDQEEIQHIKQEVIDSVKNLVHDLKISYEFREKEEKIRAAAAIKAEIVRMKELRESREYSEFVTKVMISVFVIALSVYVIKYGIDYLHEREQANKIGHLWDQIKKDFGF